MNERSGRLVNCMCCLKAHPIVSIDVGQEYVYCDECYNNCSYVYSGGKTIYHHNIRDLLIINITKEQAIEFAKKYLEDRRIQYKHPINIPIDKWTIKDHNEKLEHIMNCFIEYTILDIIPYLYGEALD